MHPGLPLSSIIVAILSLSGCFPHEAGPTLSHYAGQAPAVGDPAPRFTLRGVDNAPVPLDQLIGNRPLVLQLGSHSCPVYRYRRFGMAKLYADYRDRVNFLLIYTQEAHPAGSRSPFTDGEWLTLWNVVTNTRIPQPQSLEARRSQAVNSKNQLAIPYPMAIDEMSNTVWSAYGAAASPAYVIDTSGRVVLRQPWVDPDGIRAALERLLSTEAVNRQPE